MSTKKVLLDFELPSDAMQRLRSLPGAQVDLTQPISEDARVLPAALLRDTNVLLCSSPPTNFDDLKALEWVQLCSSGFEGLLPLRLPERGMRATNAQGVFDVPIAEWCVSMLVNLARDLRGMIRNQEQGLWERDARFQGELRGMTVGFWGYGGLARETARLCKSMGLKVHVLVRETLKARRHTYCLAETGDPEGALPDAVFSMAQRQEFLSGLDFLVLAMPLTANTRGIVGEAELRCLPSRAFLLNPARGPLVQEAALLRALREGWICGAALDTHYQYPMPPEHQLWHLPQVIMTPHISGSNLCPHYHVRMGDLFAQNLARFLRGEPLLNELSREQLSGN